MMKRLIFSLASILMVASVLFPQDAVILCAKNGLHLFTSCCDSTVKVEIVKEKESCCKEKTKVELKQSDASKMKKLCCYNSKQFHNLNTELNNRTAISFSDDTTESPAFYLAILIRANSSSLFLKDNRSNAPPTPPLLTIKTEAVYKSISSFLC